MDGEVGVLKIVEESFIGRELVVRSKSMEELNGSSTSAFLLFSMEGELK